MLTDEERRDLNAAADYLCGDGVSMEVVEAERIAGTLRALCEKGAGDALLTNAYAEGRRDEQYELASVLPGTTYMDPPDGGAPTILEQLQRQAKDAARYLWLRQQHWDRSPLCVVARPKQSVKLGCDCPSLDRLDTEVDAAMGGTDSTKGE